MTALVPDIVATDRLPTVNEASSSSHRSQGPEGSHAVGRERRRKVHDTADCAEAIALRCPFQATHREDQAPVHADYDAHNAAVSNYNVFLQRRQLCRGIIGARS